MKAIHERKGSTLSDTHLMKPTIYSGNGVTIEAWDQPAAPSCQFSLNDPASANPCVQLFYLLSPGHINFPGSHMRFEGPSQEKDCNYFFITDDQPLLFEAVTDTPLLAILINMEVEWLKSELKITGNWQQGYADQLLNQVPLAGHYSAGEYLHANDIYQQLSRVHPDKMSMLSRLFLLLSDFLERSSTGKSTRQQVPVIYCQKMIAVEKMIMSSIKRKLPTLADIAAAAGISESGLKRYFFKVYGTNIYEYYTSAKMDLAKRMLVEKNLSVAEVSEFLGFEKPKQFINSFKKHFSFLPGEIRKTSRGYLPNS